VGNDDNVSVALEYLNEKWTIREDPGPRANHIAESIAHILLTNPTEHDTLPEFGGGLLHVIFEPNSAEFRIAATHYFQYSTIRWEKRARFNPSNPESIQWIFEGLMADRGQLPCIARVDFAAQQIPGNLVAPFVTPTQARNQEYLIGSLDEAKHDYMSRYYGQTPELLGGERFIRLNPRLKPWTPAADDQYYKVQTDDTWLLISWSLYGDIRHWHMLADMYSRDVSQEGSPRSSMDTVGDPVPGTLLRAPSRTRVMLETSKF
jgi:phage baseplate assembly protein W